MTTLEELLNMMAEDAAKAGEADKRPPPSPPQTAEAIGRDEIEALDDGPVLTTDRLWPSALPRPARRGPPPPPPGRRARGTAPPDTITSGLIDVRAMALAYERAQAEAGVAPADDVIRVELPVPAPQPPAREPEAAPKPIIAEGTRPIPAVEKIEVEAAPEAEAAPEVEREKRAALWPLVARRAALVVLLGGAAALAITFVANRVLDERGAAEPTDVAARVAPREAVRTPVAAMAPADVEPETAEVAPETDDVALATAAEAAVEPFVILQPTTITEVGREAHVEANAEPTAPEEPIREVGPTVVAETAHPAVARTDDALAGDLLADGCYDAACQATSPRARRAEQPAAEATTAPARLPTRPSNSEIASAIFAAQEQIDGCGDVYGTSGAVPIKIKIAPSGAITSVAVAQGTTRFRTCVADIVRGVSMPASLVGMTASFPVLIR
jgi:hypothetical protein